jgi:hypothetical protein
MPDIVASQAARRSAVHPIAVVSEATEFVGGPSNALVPAQSESNRHSPRMAVSRYFNCLRRAASVFCSRFAYANHLDRFMLLAGPGNQIHLNGHAESSFAEIELSRICSRYRQWSYWSDAHLVSSGSWNIGSNRMAVARSFFKSLSRYRGILPTTRSIKL